MYRRRLSCLSLLLILAFAFSLTAQTARRPIKLDDMTRFRNVGDPQISPDGKLVAYVVNTHEREGRQVEFPHLDGGHRRQQRPADHVQQRERELAALESRRQVSLLHFFATGQDARQSGLASRSQRRRGNAAHRDQRTFAGARMVSRFKTAGPRDWRSRSGRGPEPLATTRRYTARPETDRHRSLPVQTGRRRATC